MVYYYFFFNEDKSEILAEGLFNEEEVWDYLKEIGASCFEMDIF